MLMFPGAFEPRKKIHSQGLAQVTVVEIGVFKGSLRAPEPRCRIAAFLQLGPRSKSLLEQLPFVQLLGISAFLSLKDLLGRCFADPEPKSSGSGDSSARAKSVKLLGVVTDPRSGPLHRQGRHISRGLLGNHGSGYGPRAGLRPDRHAAETMAFSFFLQCELGILLCFAGFPRRTPSTGQCHNCPNDFSSPSLKRHIVLATTHRVLSPQLLSGFDFGGNRPFRASKTIFLRVAVLY